LRVARSRRSCRRSTAAVPAAPPARSSSTQARDSESSAPDNETGSDPTDASSLLMTRKRRAPAFSYVPRKDRIATDADPSPPGRQDEGAAVIAHRTVEVDGLAVFYRETGDPANPKLLLLGGFPASSHQFRNLIPALADRFHLLSPDYPGFGNTDMPDDFEYTFDRLSEIVEGLPEQTGFHPFGLYHQDYGGPIGNRIVGRHPDWLEWQVIQNSNAYEEGFTTVWDGIRHALWVERSPET